MCKENNSFNIHIEIILVDIIEMNYKFVYSNTTKIYFKIFTFSFNEINIKMITTYHYTLNSPMIYPSVLENLSFFQSLWTDLWIANFLYVHSPFRVRVGLNATHCFLLMTALQKLTTKSLINQRCSYPLKKKLSHQDMRFPNSCSFQFFSESIRGNIILSGIE